MANPLRFPPRLLKSVKKVLSLDDDDESTEIPAFIFYAVESFLRTNPRDDNFVLECAEDGEAGPSSVLVGESEEGEEERKGGKGFGMVTCLETDCWDDIHLRADPSKPDGGRKNGLGGFEEYKKHCLLDKHVSGRDDRWKKEARVALLAERKAKEKAREVAEAFKNPSPRKLTTHNSLSQAMLAKNGVPSPAKKVSGTGKALGCSPGQAVYAISSSDDDEFRISQPKRARPIKPHRTLGTRSSGHHSISLLESSDEDRKPLNGVSTNRSSSARSKPVLARRPLFLEDDDVVMLEDVKPDIKSKLHFENRTAENKTATAQDIERAKILAEAKEMRATYINPKTDMLIAALCNSRGDLLTRMLEDPSIEYTPPSPQIVQHCLNVMQIRPELPDLWKKEAEAMEETRRIKASASRDVKPDFIPDIKPQLASQQAVQPYGLLAGPSRFPDPSNAVAGPSRVNMGRGFGSGDAIAPLPNFPSYAQSYYDRITAATANLARIGTAAAGHVVDTLGAIVNGVHYNSDSEDGDDGRISRLQTQHGTDMSNFFQDALDCFEETATVSEAAAYLSLASLNDCMPGMAVTLMPHQVLAVAYLLKREYDDKQRGSLLLDAMGLGKTVSCIATMVAHQSEDQKCKTTLIVAPLALLKQWEDEIMTKTDGTFAVHIYHGSNKHKKIKTLQKYDVILTTYGTLTSEYPKPEKKRKRRIPTAAGDFIDDQDDSEYAAAAAANQRQYGPLARMSFWRCILDESHTIRNRNTQAAKACFEIQAEFRISVTGTLIVNGVDDLFPHLHFAGLSTCSDWTTFREHIHTPASRRPEIAVKRMQAILNLIALRRTKDSLIDGRPILTLPEKTVEVVEEDFTREEREIYQTVETRAIVRFNRFLKAGTVMKNYSHVLLMLLRLRQCVLHPHLLTRKRGEMAGPNDYTIDSEDVLTRGTGLEEGYYREKEREKAKAIGGDALITKLEGILQRRGEDRVAAQGGDQDETADVCPICFDAYTDEIISMCGHSFCHGCLQDLCEAGVNMANMDDAVARTRMIQNIGSCPMCRQDIRLSQTFYAKAFEPYEEVGDASDDDEEDIKPRLKGKKHLFKSGALASSAMGSDGSQAEETEGEDETETKPNHGKGRNGMKRNPDDSEDDFKPDFKPDVKPRISGGKGKTRATAGDEEIDELGNEDDRRLVPSTKMNSMMSQLNDWLSANADDKILVFSQFTAFLNIVSNQLSRGNVEHDLYMGSMSRQSREQVINHFMKRNGCRVLLVSLKCGGVGLNLTIANKVINLDLAWNAATEDQAVDRVHRIGQTKPVSVKRIVIRDSVEQRILALQEKKKAIADGALGEGGASRLGRLTLQDLVSLFTRSAE